MNQKIKKRNLMDQKNHQKKADDPAERQKALDSISAEDVAKIEAHKASTRGALPVDNEWLLLAEFATAFGWEAYMAIKNNEIGLEEMMTLISASRKLRSGNLYDMSLASFIGSASTQTKNPSATFQSLTRKLINNTKADEE